MGRLSTWLLFSGLVLYAAPLAAQEEASADEGAGFAEEATPHVDSGYADSAKPWQYRGEKPGQKYYYVGAGWRFASLPSGLAKAYTVRTDADLFTPASVMLEGAIRKDGRQVGVNIGFLKLDFQDAFRTKSDPKVDTEWLDANFNFLLTTASLTWSTAFKDWFQLEYGFEAGLAFLFGSLRRNEAVYENGRWRRCDTWASQDGFINPDRRFPNDGNTTQAQRDYCAVPLGGDDPPATNAADEDGEHYGVKARRGIFNGGVPYVLPVLAPRLSLRFKPVGQLVVRVDVPLPSVPFGVVGGVAVQYGFGAPR